MNEIYFYDELDENVGKSKGPIVKRASLPEGCTKRGKCVMLKDVMDRIQVKEFSNSYEDLVWLERKLEFVSSFNDKAYYCYTEENRYNDTIKHFTITKEQVVKELTSRIKILKRRLAGKNLQEESCV